MKGEQMKGKFKYDKQHKKRDKRHDIEDKNRCSIRVYCKYCKHPNIIPAFVEKKVWSYCRRLIYNTSEAHFSYKLINMLKENKNNEYF